MQETILVTGATGTVGREVIKQLSMQDSVKVRAGVHSIIKGENLRRLPDVDCVEMEFKKPNSLHAAFTHVDRVFLVTPSTEGEVEMAKILVDEAKRTGVKYIVRLSALGADAEPGIQLGRWHREIETYIEDSGIPYTFLRPAGFMQNLVNYNADTITQEGKFYMPVGEAKVNYIDTRDIAAVAVEVLTSERHEGMAYDLTGPEALSHAEMAAILSEVIGRKVEFVDVPEEAARKAMAAQHMPESIINAMMELYGIYKAGYSGQVTDMVAQLVGRPAHTFKQFAHDYRECFLP